jgi:riboflavin kinase/FMN adenylyltransferase
MQVHYNIEDLPPFRKPVITIGTFDGVHNGHQKIIDALVAEARNVQGESILITFQPHPRKVVQPHTSLQLINTLPEKIGLLSSRAIDHLVVVPFTDVFAALTAEAYVEEFLVKYFHPHTIIIGYDHHFGRGRSGNFGLLEKLREKWSYHLTEIPKYVLQEISVSSTQIRTALLAGDVSVANGLLGYPFFFEGLVVQGDQIGRTLGFPTANLVYRDSDKIHLGEGVYAVQVRIGSNTWGGMLSIGKRPTLNDTVERVEVNIFDFNQNLYGLTIEVTVHSYLRKQEKYASLAELTNQLFRDKEMALAALS